MAHVSTHTRHQTREMEMEENDVTGWVGWIAFGSFMMMLGGIFQSIAGLMAIFNDTWFAVTQNQIVLFDITTWGWAHLLLGIIIFIAGIYLLSGAMWARTLAVILAGLSAITYFLTINIHPLWSVIGMVVASLVIYAVMVHGSELRDLSELSE